MLPAAPVGQRSFRFFLLGWSLGALACERHAPPGAEAEPHLLLSVSAEEGAGSTAEGESKIVPGAVDDQLPFTPTGEKVASIAWRTWVYTDVGPARTRLGYLRAGAVVDARGPKIENSGCEGGWYRINPRGFVCTGKGATTDLEHPVVKQSVRRAVRGQGFPYLYAMSEARPPDRYFKLPSKAQMAAVEGERVEGRAANWVQRAEHQGFFERADRSKDLPPFLAPGVALQKPYGTKSHLRAQVSAGRANNGSGFALADVFIWEGRGFGVSTEMDILPLDRLRLWEDQGLVGVEIPVGHPGSVAFHVKGAISLWERTDSGAFRPIGEQRERRGFLLTGQTASGGMLETEEGFWIAKEGLRFLSSRDQFPSVAESARKWIDISIRDQSLVAYVGKQPVYATLVSTGRGQMGDPELEHATIRGTFMIYEKSVSSTMDGSEDRADSYELSDVPFVQYFHKGFALHGAYWHDEFGRARSHGCVNLSAKDSAWIFEWTDPPVPPGWHAVLNKERGTVVHVRR